MIRTARETRCANDVEVATTSAVEQSYTFVQWIRFELVSILAPRS